MSAPACKSRGFDANHASSLYPLNAERGRCDIRSASLQPMIRPGGARTFGQSFRRDRAYSGAMSIQFPNRSRSYSETHHRIQFWGHDQSLEVSFYLEADALARIHPDAAQDETSALRAFDANRTRIEHAAMRLYTRHAHASYTLTARDL